MHVYFYNYEYWEGDREMVNRGVVFFVGMGYIGVSKFIVDFVK